MEWAELERRFRELEEPLSGFRIDGQWGAAGKSWRMSGSGSQAAKSTFFALCSIAGQILKPHIETESEKVKEVLFESDDAHLWISALHHYGGYMGNVSIAHMVSKEGEDAGNIFYGSIATPAAVSAASMG